METLIAAGEDPLTWFRGRLPSMAKESAREAVLSRAQRRAMLAPGRVHLHGPTLLSAGLSGCVSACSLTVWVALG